MGKKNKYILSDNAMVGLTGQAFIGVGVGGLLAGWWGVFVGGAFGVGVFLYDLYNDRG